MSLSISSMNQNGSHSALFKAAISYPAYLVLKVAKAVVGIFGQATINAYHRISDYARKFYVINIAHNMATLPNNMDLLVRTRNIASIHVINKGEDKKCASSLKDKFNQAYSDESVTYRPKGAVKGGICYGASLWLLRKILDKIPETEQELVKIVGRYNEGFSAEASAIQQLHLSLHKRFKKQSEKFFKEAFGALQQEINDAQRAFEKRNFPTPQMHAMLKLFKEALKNRTEETLLLVANYANENVVHRHKLIGSCVDLMHLNMTETRDMDSLDEGLYQLSLSNKLAKSSHSIVYVKAPFGSYFIDPNFGLIKSDEPTITLEKLLKKYNHTEVSVNRWTSVEDE